jgi:LacI family transcriptional regulator
VLHAADALRAAGASMAIRLKDIARELGVSVITVSKALRGNTDISEATRQRILTRMKELDYQPNLTARSLATGRSFIVGLILPDLLNPFFTELAKSLGGALRKQSYGLIVSSSEENAEIEQGEIRMMLARGVDALLIASCRPNLQGFYSIHNHTTPFVLLDRPFPHLRANFVGTDDYIGGRLATEHLIQLGRKRVAYIGSPDLSSASDRYRGFRNVLRDHDIDVRESFILSTPLVDASGDNAGYQMMQQLLRGKSRPNGVFCHNDVVAIGAMKATLDAGLSIPEDIAFVGFDNVRYSRYLQIPLTSVDQSTAQMGETAAQLALDLIAKKVDKPKNILLAPTLVIRQSTIGSAFPRNALSSSVMSRKKMATKKPKSKRK